MGFLSTLVSKLRRKKIQDDAETLANFVREFGSGVPLMNDKKLTKVVENYQIDPNRFFNDLFLRYHFIRQAIYVGQDECEVCDRLVSHSGLNDIEKLVLIDLAEDIEAPEFFNLLDIECAGSA